MLRPQNVPLALDGRMLVHGGTGVASYARALAYAQRSLSACALTLHDASSDGGGSGGRWGRRLRALWPGEVRIRREEDAFRAPDLFRLAQVYFDVHRRLLPVRPPIWGGIMHWTYPVPLRILGWRNVYTIHDAIPLTAPNLTSIDGRRHTRLLRQIAETADMLVTVSDAAAHDITAALGIAPGRIVNCSLAINLAGAPGLPPAGLPIGRYLLAIGTVEPRKNIIRLMEAHRRSGSKLPLVIAGPTGPGAEATAIEREIASAEQVIRLSYVAASDMPRLIANARALVMPSLAEGFGLPVAEAMSLGTPVITSNRGALAETAGGAALLISPEDVPAIAAAIQRVSESDTEHARLAQAGRDNARRFTMAPFVERLGTLYQSLLPPHVALDTRPE